MGQKINHSVVRSEVTNNTIIN